MKVIIDAREAFAPQKAGKGQWTAGFLKELSSRELDLTVLADEHCLDSSAVCFPSGIRWHCLAARYVRCAQPDLYLSPTSFIVPFLLGKSVPCVPVVHDLIAFRREPHDRKATIIEKLLLPRVLRSCAHVLTVSTETKADLLSAFPSVFDAAVTPVYAGPMRASSAQSNPDGKTILCVGTLCPRKNQLRLIRAYAMLPDALRSRFRLLLVGSRGWHDDAIVSLAWETVGVEWNDYVSDEEYQTLLSTATVFAYPSLYEGFGMQVLDALQRGIPVLTSDRGSLKEVAADAAVIVNPEDERSIASGLTAILEHEDVRQKLQKKGPERAKNYSWKQTVDLALSAMQSILY